MKYKMISIAVTLALIIVLGIASMVHTQKVSNDYMEMIRQVENHARNQQWAEAQRVLTAVSNHWETQKPLLQLWVVHVDTDAISTYLKEVQIGLLTREDSVLFVSSAKLIESFDHLHHKDDLVLANLL